MFVKCVTLHTLWLIFSQSWTITVNVTSDERQLYGNIVSLFIAWTITIISAYLYFYTNLYWRLTGASTKLALALSLRLIFSLSHSQLNSFGDWLCHCLLDASTYASTAKNPLVSPSICAHALAKSAWHTSSTHTHTHTFDALRRCDDACDDSRNTRTPFERKPFTGEVH